MNTSENIGNQDFAGIPGGAGDEALAREAARLLRGSAEHLDGATASRLNRARQAALAHLGRSPMARRDHRARWLTAGAATATAAALVIVVALQPGGMGTGVNSQPPAPLVGLQDPAELELILANGDNLEMMADLDFYLWLDEALAEPGSADGEAGGAVPAGSPGSI